MGRKSVGPIWSWPIQHVQSAEKNPDGLEKITDGFDDGQSISTNPEHTQLARVSDDR